MIKNKTEVRMDRIAIGIPVELKKKLENRLEQFKKSGNKKSLSSYIRDLILDDIERSKTKQ